MKKNISLIVLLLLGINLYAQNFDVYYSLPSTPNTLLPYIGNHVQSDFGPRINGGYDWHGGIDLSAADGDNDLGYNIFSIVAGTVTLIRDDGTQLIAVNGQGYNDFGYLHLFRIGVTTLGDYEMLGIDGQSGRSAILNTRTGIAVGACPSGCDSRPNNPFTVTYRRQKFNVTDQITQGQAIAPVGDSYGNSITEIGAHLHIQRWKNISNISNPFNDPNAANPLELLSSYPAPNYSSDFFTDGNNSGIAINYPSSNNNAVITNAKTPIKLRIKMDNAVSHDLTNKVMDIESVHLSIAKMEGKTRQPTNFYARYNNPINESYNAETNQANCLVARIQYGGITRTGITHDWRYPINITNSGRMGSNNLQGVSPHAYDNLALRGNNHSYDDFFFTDFIPRRSRANRNRLADLPEDAHYNDGHYFIYPVVTNAQDIRTSINDERIDFPIDNFKPYIKSVSIKKNDGSSQMMCASDWASTNNSCITLSEQNATYTIPSQSEYDALKNSNTPVKIEVVASEPLLDLELSIPNLGGTTYVNSSRITDNFEEIYTFYIDNATYLKLLDAQFLISFKGKDYGNNALLALSNSPAGACVKIPKRLSVGWADDYTQGTDVSHYFGIIG